ncbi:hypothetical protein HY991_00735, partial [Candidatus Micrarchaeota archaeon]|nr:hypothetical protein [Candidatus Micrarchaeota archaeon]
MKKQSIILFLSLFLLPSFLSAQCSDIICSDTINCDGSGNLIVRVDQDITCENMESEFIVSKNLLVYGSLTLNNVNMIFSPETLGQIQTLDLYGSLRMYDSETYHPESNALLFRSLPNSNFEASNTSFSGIWSMNLASSNVDISGSYFDPTFLGVILLSGTGSSINISDNTIVGASPTITKLNFKCMDCSTLVSRNTLYGSVSATQSTLHLNGNSIAGGLVSNGSTIVATNNSFNGTLKATDSNISSSDESISILGLKHTVFTALNDSIGVLNATSSNFTLTANNILTLVSTSSSFTTENDSVGDFDIASSEFSCSGINATAFKVSNSVFNLSGSNVNSLEISESVFGLSGNMVQTDFSVSHSNYTLLEENSFLGVVSVSNSFVWTNQMPSLKGYADSVIVLSGNLTVKSGSEFLLSNNSLLLNP